MDFLSWTIDGTVCIYTGILRPALVIMEIEVIVRTDITACRIITGIDINGMAGIVFRENIVHLSCLIGGQRDMVLLSPGVRTSDLHLCPLYGLTGNSIHHDIAHVVLLFANSHDTKVRDIVEHPTDRGIWLRRELQHIDTIGESYQRKGVLELLIIRIGREGTFLESLRHLHGTVHDFLIVVVIVNRQVVITSQFRTIDLHGEGCQMTQSIQLDHLLLTCRLYIMGNLGKELGSHQLLPVVLQLGDSVPFLPFGNRHIQISHLLGSRRFRMVFHILIALQRHLTGDIQVSISADQGVQTMDIRTLLEFLLLVTLLILL